MGREIPFGIQVLDIECGAGFSVVGIGIHRNSHLFNRDTRGIRLHRLYGYRLGLVISAR